jgi:hypothetical protein
MILERKLVVGTLLLAALSACQREPEPTLTTGDIANTAIAVAWTQLAQTQAALPTATPMPPTVTPPPTATLMPTLALPATLAAPASPTADPCNQPPPSAPLGAVTHVTVTNRSGGAISLSLGMNKPNDRGECGTYGTSMGVFGSETLKVMTGCYWGYAWVTANKPSTAETASLLCFSDPGTTYEIVVEADVIGFK